MKQIENFYITYKKDVYMYLLSLTHNPSLSEDLLSETFVNSIFSIGNSKGQSIVNMRVEGYSFGEIAKEANISENSARVIDFRTKKWIKAILEKEELC